MSYLLRCQVTLHGLYHDLDIDVAVSICRASAVRYKLYKLLLPEAPSTEDSAPENHITVSDEAIGDTVADQADLRLSERRRTAAATHNQPKRLSIRV